MFLFKANLFSKEKLRVETKPNAHSAKFIYSLSFWKPCVVRKWWNTWPFTIQAKLSNLENHILFLVQIHIGDTDSNSPLKNDKFDSFLISLITSLAKYGHRSYFKWYRQIKAITESLKVCRSFFYKFFFQELKQKYILKRIKKKEFVLKHYSARKGKCDLVVNVFSWAISNNSFCKQEQILFI